jgi:hypothetical protein
MSEFTKQIMHRLARWVSSDTRYDHFFGHPSAGAALQMVRSARWNDLESLYQSVPVDERHVIVRGVANSVRDKQCFDSWIKSKDSAIARTFKGAQFVCIAWHARGSGYADSVPKSAYDEFFKCLETAQDELYKAFELDPKDPEPLSWSLTALKGLGVNKEHIATCFERIEDTEVVHLDACWSMVQVFSPKWHGSNAEMFGFARTQANRQPGYSSCVVMAHAEKWLDARSESSNSSLSDYFRKTEVKQEILEVYQRDSIIKESGSYFGLMACSAYAFAFYQCGDYERAAPLLKRIGELFTILPWDYEQGTRRSAINRARLACELPELTS